MPAKGGSRRRGLADDPSVTGPLSVPDLLAKSGQSGRRSGRRIAARQAVVDVRRHRVRRSFAVLLTFLLALLASAAAYYVGLFFYLDRTIDRVAALALDAPGIMSPQAQDAADNFLIVGVEPTGAEVEVTSALIAHLEPGRDRAVLVSLPLTALIDVPACPRGGQSLLTDPYGGSLASSYTTAGAGCLVRSVQQLSGMRMDHYVQLDVDRLPPMVDALGGVPVCLPANLSRAGMSAGSSVLDADQVRALLTEADADQDPTGQLATDRQRLLLASTLHEALRLGNLTNPIALTGFLNEVANGLTLDRGTTLGALKDLGDKLGEFTAGDTVQASVPLAQQAYQPVGSEQSYALIDDLASREMFRAIIGDSDLPAPVEPASSPDAAATPTESTPPPAPVPEPGVLTIAPQQITVNVFNGVGTRGLATDAADALSVQGFGIAEIENQITGATESIVRYPPDQLEAARTVAAAVPDSVLQEGNTAGGFIDLVLGSSFTDVVPVVVSTPVPPPSPSSAP
ncbi:MAG: LCP family protein, partial [Geodermatophilaceae bacterium]